MNYTASNKSGHKTRVSSVEEGKAWIAKQVQEWRNTGAKRIPEYSLVYDCATEPVFVTDENGDGRDIQFVSKYSK